jgi:SAM-dependent methyltransferase
MVLINQSFEQYLTNNKLKGQKGNILVLGHGYKYKYPKLLNLIFNDHSNLFYCMDIDPDTRPDYVANCFASDPKLSDFNYFPDHCFYMIINANIVMYESRFNDYIIEIKRLLTPNGVYVTPHYLKQTVHACLNLSNCPTIDKHRIINKYKLDDPSSLLSQTKDYYDKLKVELDTNARYDDEWSSGEDYEYELGGSSDEDDSQIPKLQYDYLHNVSSHLTEGLFEDLMIHYHLIPIDQYQYHSSPITVFYHKDITV